MDPNRKAGSQISAVEFLDGPGISLQLSGTFVQGEETQIVIAAVVNYFLFEVFPAVVVSDGHFGTRVLGEDVLLEEVGTLLLDFLIVGILVVVG